MPVDTSFYSGNPLRSVQDYQALNDQNQLRKQSIQQNALVFQDRQRALDESTAMRNALASGVDPRTPEGRASLIQVAPNAAGAVIKSLGDAEHVAAQTGHENATAGGLNFDLRVKKADQAIKDISNLQSPDEAAASIFAHHKAGDIDDTKAAALIRGLPQDANQFGQWKNQMLMGIMSAKEKLTMTRPDYKFENTGGAMTPVQTNSYAGPVGTTQAMPAIPITESANNVANNQRVAKEGAANRANQVQIEREKGATSLKVAGVGEDGPTGDVEKMAQMIASGQLPPLSSFAIAKPRGQQIMARVSEINPEYDATDFSAKKKAQGDFASGKEGRSIRSFNVALEHLDTLGGLADALKNGDAPLINKISNAYATQTGGTAPNNFDAAKKIVGDEIVKAIVGAGGGVADRKAASDTIDAAKSPDQLAGVIAQYKELMTGQLTGLKQQYEATTKKTDFDEKFLTDKSRAQLKAKPKSKEVNFVDLH